METHIGIKVAENLRTGKVTGNRRTGSKVARKNYTNKVAESRAGRKFTKQNHMQSQEVKLEEKRPTHRCMHLHKG